MIRCTPEAIGLRQPFFFSHHVIGILLLLGFYLMSGEKVNDRKCSLDHLYKSRFCFEMDTFCFVIREFKQIVTPDGKQLILAVQPTIPRVILF